MMTEKERREHKRASDRRYRRNKAFVKKTPAEQRVEIAKDVITMIDADEIMIKAANSGVGGYLCLPEFGEILADNLRLDTLLRREFPDGAGCQVCALGACFMALVDRVDGVNVGDIKIPTAKQGGWGDELTRVNQINNAEFIKGKLRGYFDEVQIDMIEAAFEVSGVFSGGKASWAVLDSAKAFGRKIVDSPQRLKAIMQNIVDNAGEFKP